MLFTPQNDPMQLEPCSALKSVVPVATPAQSDGSENMLFRLADAAIMDVDLDGSVGSPVPLPPRQGPVPGINSD